MGWGHEKIIPLYLILTYTLLLPEAFDVILANDKYGGGGLVVWNRVESNGYVLPEGNHFISSYSKNGWGKCIRAWWE